MTAGHDHTAAPGASDDGYDGAELRRISARHVASDIEDMRAAAASGPTAECYLPMGDLGPRAAAMIAQVGGPAVEETGPWHPIDELPQDTMVVVRGHDMVERPCVNHMVQHEPGEAFRPTMPREWRLP